MAVDEPPLPKKLTALLFLSFFLIQANSQEKRECWYATSVNMDDGLWCLKGKINDVKPGECIVAGSPFTLSCRLEITAEQNTRRRFTYGILPTRSMLWFKDGRGKGAREVDDSQFSYFKVESSQLGDSGNYSCRAEWGEHFEKTISVNVHETFPKLTANQSNIRVKLNDSATLSCHVKGHAPTNFMWKHTGIKGVSNVTNLGKTSPINNTDSTMTLHLSDVTLDMRGIYECRARICSRKLVDSINLTVFDVPKISKVYARAVGARRVCLNWTLDDGNDPAKLSAVRRIENRTESSPNVRTTISNSSLLQLRDALVVDNLNDSTAYQFEVVFTNSAGDSLPAYSERITTLGKDPDFIPKLEIAGVSLDLIDVRASAPPAELQDCVGYYEIMISGNEEGEKRHNWTDIDSTFRIKNLTAETSYRLRVAACNACLGKCGNWSDEEEVSTAGKEFTFVANISVKATKTDSIKIGWNKPSPAEMRRILRYIATAISENDTKEEKLDRTIVSFIFENLQPNATYEFGLTVCIYGSEDCANNRGSAKVRADARNRDPVFVPSVSIPKTTFDSVLVVWTTPSKGEQDSVARYKVQATNGNETKGPVGLPNNTNSHTFGGLEPESMFQFQVAACGIYEEQCGNWSAAENGTTTAREVVRGETLWPSLVAVALLSVVAMGVWTSGPFVENNGKWFALRREFIEATLQRFNRGALDSMDPESDVAAQAELLPYDKKWEFPRELLTLDKILGQGAFGVVRKAEARSICKGQKFTIVAVKLVRATARLHCMTALQRELKILANLGKHLNIVNLLGACTKNVPYGELFVIVEFCRFGNLRDLLLARRTTFVDQFATTTNQITADSNSSEACDDASDTGDDVVSNEESTELDPQSKYQGDYLAEDLEPISTQDLLCWAWQVTRGMDYLGSKKILHGDLAARNILLADHNVVKICDFGMARHLDKDDSYHKKGQEPLPVKWMAIESLRDRVFSIQSDVWSFGIVLWEFFTLGQTPYVGTIDPERLYQKLTGGYRLAQPEYANSCMYQLMLECWDAEPSTRPSFKVLSGCIGDVLEEGVKMHYMELSRPLDEMNAELTEIGTMDYLVMTPAELKSIAIGSTFGSTIKSQSERNTEIEIGNLTVEYKCSTVGDPMIHFQKPRQLTRSFSQSGEAV